MESIMRTLIKVPDGIVTFRMTGSGLTGTGGEGISMGAFRTTSVGIGSVGADGLGAGGGTGAGAEATGDVDFTTGFVETAGRETVRDTEARFSGTAGAGAGAAG